MPPIPKSVLKAYFEKGDKPTQNQFYSLIDSSLNLVDDRTYLGLKIYNTAIGYQPGDITVYNGVFYEAIAATSGTFDPSAWAELGGSAAIISLTFLGLAKLKSSSSLSPGQLYYITDKGIWIRALTTSELSLTAQYLATNADYQNTSGNNLGVWNSSLAGIVAMQSVVIWNNLHWLSLTGAVGIRPDADPSNWQLQSPATDPTYIIEIDSIKYDIDLDFIFERSDKRGNFVSTIRDGLGMLGAIPIEVFQWGRDGVDGNFVKNAIFNNMNCVTRNFSVELTDFSIVTMEDVANCSNAIFSGAVVYASMTSDLQNSIIRNFPIRTTSVPVINPGKRIESGFSNFEDRVEITSLTVLDLTFVSYSGIVIVSSSNASETLLSCNNPPLNHPFEIRPTNGLTLSISNGTGHQNEFALEAADITLNGSKGDYAKFRVDSNNVVRFIEMVNYA